MLFALHVIVMSSAFFNPSFAFNSHFDTDGEPQSELSWPSSLAVVAISFSGLFTFVFLMLACLCCKKGDIGFKEFENTEGKEYQADLSALASPSSQNGTEVYILPLTEVSLPVSKQPGRSIQLLKSSDIGRHSLLYLKEIGHGWFGKVLLGEVTAGVSTTQVVVKELNASASVQDQFQFLEEAQPYRTLQHPALLQCLAQCSEVTPYLIVMEFCPLGDVKNYLGSCRATDSDTPDALILQRMACDFASGLLHLHKYNFIHSDVALRNCLLTSEMSVKIGDYGLSHSRYKEDYFITQDQLWVPLRWIAPELIDEVHGNLLVVDQTKSSNIWSVGVTLWELFELGNQPYRHYSDRQVLTYAVKEQQLKLPKPQLRFPLDDRWYEVMQFCWLQPELRPSSEEVHLLITYLCAKGSSEAEEDFEQRWNALKPNLLGSTSHTAASTTLVLTPTPDDIPSADQTQAVELASSASSSFPLLEHFSDSFHSDTGDDLLTVTETSHGLNFEYKWEPARAEQPYCSSSTSGHLGQENPHYQDIYYSNTGSTSVGCKTDSLTSSRSPSYYKSEHTSVVPVLSAHSPSISSEYYIQPVQHNIKFDDCIGDYCTELESSNRRLSSENQASSYWSTNDNIKADDSSPTIQLHTHPLLSPSSNEGPVKSGCSYNSLPSYSSNANYCDKSLPPKIQKQPTPSTLEKSPEIQINHLHTDSLLENPCSLSQAISSPSLGFCDPYLEPHTGQSTVKESCHNMLGPLRITLHIVNHVDIDVGEDDDLQLSRRKSRVVEDKTNWISNRSANNNSFDSRHTGGGNDSCVTLRSDATDTWVLTKATTRTFQSFKPCGTLGGSEEGPEWRASCMSVGLDSYIQICHKESAQEKPASLDFFQSNSALTNSNKNSSSTEGGKMEPQTDQTGTLSDMQRCNIWEGVSDGTSVGLSGLRLNYAETSKTSRNQQCAVDVRDSRPCLVELGDYSEDEEDDITDITSGIFADFNLDLNEVEEEDISPKKILEGNSDALGAINVLSSVASSCEQAFSSDPYNTPILPKSLDSGYDTENNESPEFMFKELGDPLGGESCPGLGGESEIALHVGLAQGVCTSTITSELHVKSLVDNNPYRDSAYFSDYDVESERSPKEEGRGFFAEPVKRHSPDNALSSAGEHILENNLNCERNLTNLRHLKNCVLANLSEANSHLAHNIQTPEFSMLSPFPQQMGGCLTKEAAPADDDMGLDTEHSGDEPASELNSLNGSEPSSSVLEASANHEEGSRGAEGCSSVHSTVSGCSITECRDKPCEENENVQESSEEENVPEQSHVSGEKEHRREGGKINEEDFEDIDAEECDNLCEESNGPQDLSTSSSLLELCGEDVRAPLEEAEDEDDSDESESDEELRTYNIQDEESEGSEEDFSTVLVVVSDCSRARHLRSLLKMPTLLTQSFCEELERKKKAVSFFDDVTVFLFDQESPTGELADCSFSTEGEPIEQETSNLDLEAQSDDAQCFAKETDENNLAQGGNFEWEEKHSVETLPSTLHTIPEPVFSHTSVTDTAEVPKPVAVPLNRFMVSRFSITHVSDSHAGIATGNTEDTPKR
ncbi:serine/threonine-protein kinase LMTK1-like [Girardinichthys multiradiatus]|uniref:serine/threonine-protein kinase LMTK1-like n=1 Tax=Girardinichthys multiradiatus TaxID=208333 RepID=UPI001FADD65F|nr:serine/threonine-protein kinase LMTK1-like [Girardinichthys multiradiatus]XP_047214149.1 serine/threonine-protein kinase LMTK1-like [Girardinichthys multiradiatus]